MLIARSYSGRGACIKGFARLTAHRMMFIGLYRTPIWRDPLRGINPVREVVPHVENSNDSNHVIVHDRAIRLKLQQEDLSNDINFNPENFIYFLRSIIQS